MDDLYLELRRLCERLPLPDASWHPFAGLIGQLRADMGVALDVCAERPALRSVLAEVVAGERSLVFDGGAERELTEAHRRLHALPMVEGRHPFIDEIVPTLEGAEALLVCLSCDSQAAADFAARSSTVRAGRAAS
jgi:hypothetical protein